MGNGCIGGLSRRGANSAAVLLKCGRVGYTRTKKKRSKVSPPEKKVKAKSTIRKRALNSGSALVAKMMMNRVERAPALTS